MHYHHTQRGTMILLALVATGGIAALAFVVAAAGAPFNWGMLIPLVMFALVLVGVAWFFSSMTVDVNDNEVRWSIGPMSAKTIKRSDIESASIALHPWWYGYGIRWLGPKRWTYIVAGRDTVELRLKAGGYVRLGTDDPHGLLAALTGPRHV